MEVECVILQIAPFFLNHVISHAKFYCAPPSFDEEHLCHPHRDNYLDSGVDN